MAEDLNFNNGKGTFLLSRRRALSHNMPTSHFHSTYEIYYLLSGKRELFIKDRTVVIQEGDVAIIPPNILHRTTNAEQPQHERVIVNLHPDILASACPDYAEVLKPLMGQDYLVIRCSLQERLFTDGIIRSVLQELEERKTGFELFAQSLVIQLLIFCCRHVEEVAAAPLEFPSPMHARISEVVRYINQHYAENLSLHLLADRFYVSPYYLSRFFKEATGFTFVEYLNSVRIKEAKKLLEQTELKVTLIAERVGFGSITHFGRVFKSVTGHTPLFYRKACQ